MVVLVYTKGDDADHNTANLALLTNKMKELVKKFGIRTDILTHTDESDLLAWPNPISVNEDTVDPVEYSNTHPAFAKYHCSLFRDI